MTEGDGVPRRHRPQARDTGRKLGAPRVAIAIRDELPRLGVAAAVRQSGVARVVASISDAAQVESVLAETTPDILVLDVRFRRADPTLLPRLSRRYSGCRIIMFVAHTAQQCVLRDLLGAGGRARLSPAALARVEECCLTSLQASARGCIPSEASAHQVVEAITEVTAGRVAAAPWLGEFAGFPDGSRPGAITPRELEVLAQLAKGLSNKAIARELGIREKTVKNHTARLMSKLGLESRAQVGVLAARHNVRVAEPIAR